MKPDEQKKSLNNQTIKSTDEQKTLPSSSSVVDENMPSVMFIGDRGVGKTTLAVELANPKFESRRVKITSHSYQQLMDEYYKPVTEFNEDGQPEKFWQAIATPEEKNQQLNIQVTLPSQLVSTFSLRWLDTPGELLSSSPHNLATDDFDFSHKIIKSLETARGIIFVLTPHRNLVDPKRLRKIQEPIRDPDRIFPPYDKWVKQFRNYLNALEKHATAQHQILFCLNMADLFCEPKDLVKDLGLMSTDAKFMHIQDIIVNRFLPSERPLIDQYHRRTRGNILNFCVTSKYNRSLLEFPWTYLASCF